MGNRAEGPAMRPILESSKGCRLRLPTRQDGGRVEKAFNRAYRCMLSLSYPVLCKMERTFGVRSDVALVAVWHGEKLLVVRHSYQLGDALPGGTIRAGEAPVEAAVRELGEEVGILTGSGDLVLLRRWTQEEGKRWLFEFRPPTLPEIVLDEREVIGARFVTQNRIPTRIRAMLEQPA
jgi:8-oxo-dGTP diphosphatase